MKMACYVLGVITVACFYKIDPKCADYSAPNICVLALCMSYFFIRAKWGNHEKPQ